MVKKVYYWLLSLTMLLTVTGCEYKIDNEEPIQDQKPVQAVAVEPVPEPEPELKPDPEPVSEPVPEPEPKQLTIRFETSTTSGKYSPKNVHAVWVETAGGDFVRTLDLWGNKHAKQLTEFKAAVGDLAAAVAARTGATQKAYGAYSSRWDLKDAAGNVVPDGDYVIRLEMTSDNAKANKYHRASVPFTKNGTPVTSEPAEVGGYKNIVLETTFLEP